ncbi:phosphatidylinositol 3-kinase 3-like [Apis laboriosa]|uniref:phosphatidylinositol 3-kinase 3-like n=1 Tax=Apis laboriosa TaxID=183418 RepID=UPI001CC7FE2F|nr:phosphatidylinositol 3-kinase 3-like [Apis laboriosa]
MKSFIIILLFQFLILIVVSQPVNKLTDIDTDTNYGVHRYPRTLISFPPCKMNQYFDKEKGFCLNVLGGGKALYINNTSCGTNVLKPHCFNPRYYYICKKNKTILAQCSQNKHFEVHLQKCILIYHGKNTPNKTNSNSCQKVGVFPIPNDCHQFYTCTAYGHRMKQNFYICPKNMAFDTKTEMCKPSSTCKESRLSSTCLFSNEKEDMTLEEANMFLRLEKKEKSLMCETIFTSDEETMTTERNYNNDEIKSTTTSYNKPSVSEFTEPSDRKFITTMIERASGTSHSINTVASEIYTTAMYSPTNEEITYTTEQNLLTEIKKNGEENLESSTSKESYKQEHNGKTINNNVQSTDAMKTFPTEPTILDDTTSRETRIEKQPGIEIKTHPNESPNFKNQYSTTTAEFYDATHHWYISHSTPATEDLNEPLTTEEQITDLQLTTINGSLDEEKHIKINSNDPSSEIPHIIQPNVEISTSTPTAKDLNEPTVIEEEITDLPSTTTNSNLDENGHTKINSNDRSSEISNITQPNIEIPNFIPATEDLNESIATEEQITDLPSTTINGNLDEEEHIKINSNDQSSEIPNITQPNIKISSSTPVTENLNESIATEEQTTDLPSTTINGNLNEEEHTKINSNDQSSEIPNFTQSNIEMSTNTIATENLNEPLTTQKEIIDLPSATINDNPDIEKLEINLNDSSSNILNTPQPNIEISNNTAITEDLNEPIATEEQITDLPSTTINDNLDEEEHIKINLYDQSSEIPNITQPNIKIPNSTPVTEDLNEPIATEEQITDLPSTTINGNLDEEEHPKINSNDLSSEILSTTQPNIEILNSTPAVKDLNEPITTEEPITDLPSTTINGNLDVEEYTKINSNDSSSEIPNITQPSIEIPNSTIAIENLNEPLATQKEIIDLPSTTINDGPDVEKPEINLNDSSSNILDTPQPNIEILNNTAITEDLNEPIATEEQITDLPSTTINGNLDEEEHTKINSNDLFSEILNTTQPNIKIPNSTPVTEDLNEPIATEEQITDLPSTTINGNLNEEEHTKINSTDQSSEIPNFTQPNIEISISTIATENLNEPIATEEQITDLPLTTINGNLDEEEHIKINSNDQSSEIPNFTQPNIEISISTIATENLNEPIATEEQITDLPSTTINGNLDVEEYTKINSNDSSSEIPNITQPSIEIPNSTIAIENLNEPLATQKEIIDLPSATINDDPDVEKPEINLNDSSSNILDTPQPNIEILNNTAITEDLNEPIATEEQITDLPSTTINGNLDEEEHTKINSNDLFSEILNTTQPNIEILNSTPAVKDLNEPITTEEPITDLPSTTINGNFNEEEHTKINSTDQSSEIPNFIQPNIEISTSTIATENLNKPLATQKEIIDLPSATINDNPDIEKLEINLNDPSSDILNTPQSNIEIPNNTRTIKFNESIEEENSDFISTNNDSEVKKEKKTDINLNDPLSEILITGIPNIEMEHNIVTTMKVTEQSTFKTENSDIISEIPSNTLTSIKENDIHTIINLNDSSMEITTPSLQKHMQ